MESIDIQQAPLGSGFGAATTAEEALQGCDLSGKTAIVTGGYAGIGLETTRALLAAGAKVVVPARDGEKAAKALRPLQETAEGAAGLTIEAMDLMDPASVDAFAGRFLAGGGPLHLLLNNAGVMANPLTRDSRGYESQFATNHLGHFQLTARLWPALRRAGGARVVELSSIGHRRAGVDFDDPNFERREYDRWVAYGQAKSANSLFAVALDALGKEHGVRAFAVHPGGIITDLARYMSADELRVYGMLDEDGRPVIDPANNKKTPQQGAATTLWCAVSPQLEGRGGVYCENCDIAAVVPDDDMGGFGVRSWAIRKDFADRLWELSERLAGVGLAR